MLELDFNKEIDNSLIDELTYSSAVAQIELYGMTWDGVATLWPDKVGLMQARYEAENGKRGDV